MYVQIIMLACTFIGLPLCYFYGETYDEFEEIPKAERFSKSIKRTAIFLGFVIICIFFSRSFKNQSIDINGSKEWIQQMLDS